MLTGMSSRFADMLRGGHPNSLGNTEQVVSITLADHDRLDELFAAIADPDGVVRMRVGDALEKVCREQPGWFVPRIDHIIDVLGNVDQPSVQCMSLRCFSTSAMTCPLPRSNGPSDCCNGT